MAVKIQFRRDLAANWGSSTVLASGEVGYETDTGNIKIGNGSTQWSALAYYQLPNVSVNPATTADLNNAAYRVMGRYRLNSVTGGSTFTNAPSDLDTADADSYCAMIVTSHAYSGLTTLIQQTLTQFSGNGTTLKQWVRMYNGTNYTAWTSTAHLTDGEVTTAKLADNAVTAAKLADDSSTDANRAVTTNHIRDSAVTTAKIADDSVTFAKMQNSAAAGLSVVGRTTNSAGAFSEVAAGTDGHVLRRASGTSLGFGTITNSSIDANAGIALSKLASQTATTFTGNATGSSAVPTAIGMGVARTMLGLGSAAYTATGDYTPNPQTAAGVGQIKVWDAAGVAGGNVSITVGATGQNWAVWWFSFGSSASSRELGVSESGVAVTSGTTSVLNAVDVNYGKVIVAIGIRLA